jgi:uncharacterized protein YndB with AHSA1/START domain
VAPAVDRITREPKPSDQACLKLRRIFDAPCDLVWRAWTRPEMTAQWLGPVEWPAVQVAQDLRKDGAWSALLKSADGDETLRQSGIYLEIDPPKRLVFTFAWGEGHEDGVAVETIVCVELTALSGQRTLLEFSQAGLKSAASASGHAHGWTSSFDRLDACLVEQTSKRG